MSRQNNDDIKNKLYKESPMCGICKQPLTILETFSPMVNVDHKIPRYRGGSNSMENLQLAHKKCNLEKGHA